MSNLSLSRMNALLKKVRAERSAVLEHGSAATETPPRLPIESSTIETAHFDQITSLPSSHSPISSHILDKNGAPIILNSKQMEFVHLVTSEASAVLIGAAGTGKTTCQKAVVQALISCGLAGMLDPMGHKHLPANTPGIVICAYTRRATANIRRNVSTEMQNNCITIHKLLEYAPVYNEIYDSETGNVRTKMSFEPARNSDNPLPSSIHTIIIEEASMVSVELYEQIVRACPHKVQFIFLGDIQQLPPVFGSAILGFKLLELPVIELTEVYRQALDSPIIALAHRILSGNPILSDEFPKWKIPNKLTIHPWKKRIESGIACSTAGQFFIAAEKAGAYDPEEDIILCPFNKAFGTDELNKIVANHLSKKRNSPTYEILAGFEKHYFSPGDKVLFDKLDAIIISIEPNPSFVGQRLQPHSQTLDYWGFESCPSSNPSRENELQDIDFILEAAALPQDERTAKCSHKIRIKFLDSEHEQTLDKASEVNTLSLGYVLTFFKAQGSEWARVFITLHQSHSVLTNREALYTAVTRARSELYIICEPDTFEKGILTQKIKGNTLAEKAIHFQGKMIQYNERSGK